MAALSNNVNVSRTRRFLGNVTKYIKICCVIKPLQLLVARNCCNQKMAYMRSLPANTVGRDLAHMLDSRGLRLVPGFAKHDLDHLIPPAHVRERSVERERAITPVLKSESQAPTALMQPFGRAIKVGDMLLFDRMVTDLVNSNPKRS